MWLTGIRVVDFTMLLPGPFATLRLADLGADVIRIEPPNGGDPARHTGPKIQGTGVVFVANNRNKKSLVLDLKTNEGQEEALRLIETSDVVIEGFRPGVMQKLGLHYDAAKACNGQIIYCSLTGYGQTGPYAKRAGHDLNYAAESGVLSQLLDGTGYPITPSIQLGDMIGGIVASEAILAALVKRERTGEGSYLDVSMTDALTGLLGYHALLQQSNGSLQGLDELRGERICYRVYETKDGRMVSLAALEPKFWAAFCNAVDKPEWIDAQFHTAKSGEPVYEEVKRLFQERTFTEWALFGEQVDCCLQPVQDIGEVLVSRQTKERNLTVEDSNSNVGTVLQLETHAGGYKRESERSMGFCSE